jgi:predicted nucleic-acid-binding protein
VRITADTNVLVRALTEDDPDQSPRAQAALREAEVVAVPTPVFCELVWVLRRGYRLGAEDVADAIRRLLDSKTVAADSPSIEAGLAILEAGGDFADGAIAFEGARLGGEVYLSFDETAVDLALKQGLAAQRPA